MKDLIIKSTNGIIETDKFTIKPSSKKEIDSFLKLHLGKILIEIVNIDYYSAECNVKSESGNKIVNISLPASIIHHSLSNR